MSRKLIFLIDRVFAPTILISMAAFPSLSLLYLFAGFDR